MSQPDGSIEMHADTEFDINPNKYAIEHVDSIRHSFGEEHPVVMTDEFARKYIELLCNFVLPLYLMFISLCDRIGISGVYRTISCNPNPGLEDALADTATEAQKHQVERALIEHRYPTVREDEPQWGSDVSLLLCKENRCLVPMRGKNVLFDTYKKIQDAIRDDIKYCPGCEVCSWFKIYFDKYLRYMKSLAELKSFVHSN